MSQVRLVVRDAQRAIFADPHGSDADRVIGALSADPETIEELEAAMERFTGPSEKGYFHHFYNGLDDRPYDAGLVVIDLAARLIVCDSTYSGASRSGCLAWRDERGTTEKHVRYHLSDEWRIRSDSLDWDAEADDLREKRLANPPIDARPILYGRPLLEFIGRECWAAFSSLPRENPSETGDDADDADTVKRETYDRIRQIHVRWLSEPREDLRGQAPRDLMLANHEQIGWDLQDRSEQWSEFGRCLPPLAPESAAYRFWQLRNAPNWWSTMKWCGSC